MAEWPNYFPQQCPPEDAVESQETFYRLVSDPVYESDFWSYRDRVAAGLDKPRRGIVDECLAVGVSIFDEVEAVAKIQRAVPALRARKIAGGSLLNSGVVKQTGNNARHHTWWRPLDDLAWVDFEAVVS